MKYFFLLYLLVLGVGPASAQTREIYTNAKFRELAKDHKILAILPFRATLSLRPAEVAKQGGPDGVHQLEEREGRDVQSALQSYFLKQKEDKDLLVDVQDIAKTNALLAQNSVTYDKLQAMTMEQLAQLLGVDGIISGAFESTQPMSNGAALAMTMVVGFGAPTNTGKLTININDGKTGELLWKYDKTLSRGLGSNTSTIVMVIMRKASRQFPYSKEFKS